MPVSTHCAVGPGELSALIHVLNCSQQRPSRLERSCSVLEYALCPVGQVHCKQSRSKGRSLPCREGRARHREFCLPGVCPGALRASAEPPEPARLSARPATLCGS